MSGNLSLVHLYKDIDEEIMYDILKIIINYYNNVKYSCDGCSRQMSRGILLCEKCSTYLCEDCHILRVKY